MGLAIIWNLCPLVCRVTRFHFLQYHPGRGFFPSHFSCRSTKFPKKSDHHSNNICHNPISYPVRSHQHISYHLAIYRYRPHASYFISICPRRSAHRNAYTRPCPLFYHCTIDHRRWNHLPIDKSLDLISGRF